MVRGKAKSGSNEATTSSSNKTSKVTACALGPDGCKRPDGKVSWVCCDGCEAWYHCNCVNVDPKVAKDIIFHCKTCQPLKEKEFDEIRESIKSSLSEIMKIHSVFSTSAIPRRCFASKAKADEYHSSKKEIPVTLKELSEKVDKEIPTVDHFKKTSEVMFDKMKSSLKMDFEDEIIKMSKKVEKISEDVLKNKKKAAAVKKNGKTKKEEEKAKKEEEEPMDDDKEEVKEKVVEKKSKKADLKKEKSIEKDEKTKVKKEAKPEVNPSTGSAANPEEKSVADLKCEMCKKDLAPPIYQCVDLHVVCHVCLHGSERGYCPICRDESGKNRRPKKHDKKETLKSKEAQNDELKMEEDTPLKIAKANVEKRDVVEEDSMKMEVDDETPTPSSNTATIPTVGKEEVVKEQQPAAVAAQQPVAKTRKRRGKNEDPAKGETKQKTKKIAAPAAPKAKRLTKAEKKMQEAKAKAEMAIGQTKLDENTHPPKLETLFATGAPANLPKSVLLPTAPIVQNLLPKSPQPQVATVQAFQLRPTTGNLQISSVPTSAPGSPPQFRMQASSPQNQAQIRPQGLQFFKIVEGKPVQIGGSLVSGDGNGATVSGIQPRLPTTPLPMQPNAAAGVGPKMLYVRNPLPAASTAAPSSSLSPTRPQLAQKQIILLSNKGPGKAHILTPVSPTNSQGGIVKLVSTGGNGDGNKMMLGSNVARVAPQLQGPVLLRPISSLPSAPIPTPQLPNVPLPRAALNSAPAIDKAQALLPKSPLPPAQIKNAPMMKMPVGPPSLGTSTSALTTTTTTTTSSSKSDSVINKAFVWKNSDKTQFKLSARFNFDLFREYQKAHPNKDIRFALASIVTEDKSNEFSFHLSQQKEENNESFWQLGVRAKNVSEHVWHLKVKVEPPVFLVNNGSFKQTMANFRIPKDVSDKAVVDYELLLMGKASAVATAALSGGPMVGAKASRGSKKEKTIAAAQQLQKQPQ